MSFRIISLILISTVICFSQEIQFPWLPAGEAVDCETVSSLPLPDGFKRIAADDSSFAAWLRQLPLKAESEPVKLYDGRLKSNQRAHFRVLNMDVGNTNLQQCADAVIRLRAEYLYWAGKRDSISFCFTSGDRVDYFQWLSGKQPEVSGNKVKWVDGPPVQDTYSGFRKYLRTIFIYAGSFSLEKELHPVEHLTQMHIGDVFITGGFPGHAVLVADMAVNPHTGEKMFVLVQSYMPAQDIHVLKNPDEPEISPWYRVKSEGILNTPEWQFHRSDLKRF